MNPKDEKSKVRQIIIETDGSYVKIVKNETSNLELFAILQSLLSKFVNSQNDGRGTKTN